MQYETIIDQECSEFELVQEELARMARADGNFYIRSPFISNAQVRVAEQKLASSVAPTKAEPASNAQVRVAEE